MRPLPSLLVPVSVSATTSPPDSVDGGVSKQAAWPNGPVVTSGRWILDASGKNLTYAGTNWPGHADPVPEHRDHRPQGEHRHERRAPDLCDPDDWRGLRIFQQGGHHPRLPRSAGAAVTRRANVTLRAGGTETCPFAASVSAVVLETSQAWCSSPTPHPRVVL